MREDIIPEWLNNDFFTSLLQHKISFTEVVSHVTSPAVSQGNNNCSRMWRVKVSYKDRGNELKSISLMVKAPIPDGHHKDFLDEMKFVEKEFLFYNKFVPAMSNISDKVHVIPKCYSSPVPDIIVLEDLSGKGFKMCDRLKQLDFDHSRTLMATIAKYHALSVAVAKKHPELVTTVGKEHIFVTGNQDRDGFLKQCLDGFSKAVKAWKGCERFHYLSGDKIELFCKKFTEILVPRRSLNVLNHGDLWINNILFKYNEDGKVNDAMLIDFQLCKYASPGVDLNFFIWSSIQEDVRDNRIEELKKIYLNTLNYKLNEFGCEDRLTEDRLEEELAYTRIVAIFVLFFMLPVVLADPEDNEDSKVDSNLSNNRYNGKYYKPTALKLLFHLEKTLYNVFCN